MWICDWCLSSKNSRTSYTKHISILMEEVTLSLFKSHTFTQKLWLLGWSKILLKNFLGFKFFTIFVAENAAFTACSCLKKSSGCLIQQIKLVKFCGSYLWAPGTQLLKMGPFGVSSWHPTILCNDFCLLANYHSCLLWLPAAERCVCEVTWNCRNVSFASSLFSLLSSIAPGPDWIVWTDWTAWIWTRVHLLSMWGLYLYVF